MRACKLIHSFINAMPVSDQGELSDRYSLVPRTLIFLTSGERILLLKGAPDKRLWANLYNGIGGHIERGEDVLGAAYRELREETGISSVRLWLCGLVTIDTGQEVGIGLYVLRGEFPASEASFSSKEGELEWIFLEQLDSIPLVEDLPTLLPRLLALRPSDPPLSAHYYYGVDGKLCLQFFEENRTNFEYT